MENRIPEGSPSYTAELGFDPNLYVFGVLSLNMHSSSDPALLEINGEVPCTLFQPPQVVPPLPPAPRPPPAPAPTSPPGEQSEVWA